MIKQIIKFLAIISFLAFFFYIFVEAFVAWDTAPPPTLPDCVDGTIRVEYGNCVLPEEIDHGP